MTDSSTLLVPVDSQSTACFQAKRILIVDDEPITARVASQFLARQGFDNVLIQTDSRQVMDDVYLHQPDLVLLDIFMPHLDGLKLLTQIRQDPKLNQVLVLMLSSASEEERFKSLEMGAMGFIQKPVDSLQLVENINSTFRIALRLGII